jgi:hypothetical protein
MTDALDNYRGTQISGSKKFTPLSEENKGKPKLDSQEEYIFELVKRDLNLDARGFLSKEDAKAGQDAPRVAKVYLTWRELKTGNLVVQIEQIDKLYWGNPDGSMKSGVLSFLEDIGMAVPLNTLPSWGTTFILTMKIRARVNQRIKNNVAVPDEYIFKNGTFRKYQV